jgi:hypothetical protein
MVLMGDSLRTRIWIDGVLIEDREISLLDAWVGPGHAEMCRQAERDGKVWLVEIDDPDHEVDGLPLRFGNDTRGMVDPILIDLDALTEAKEDPRRWR